MIKVSNLSLALGGHPLFDDTECVIAKREKVGLIGRNGSGKSTFLKMLLGEIEHDDGKIDRPKDYRIGYLQQHIEFSKKTAFEEVCSVLPQEREFEEWKADMIIAGLGFTEEEKESDPMSFSGGNQVKLNLAKLLLLEPQMLLLDEPTNYLDIHAIKWLREFLQDWQQELVLITHDRSFMDSIITHTLFIHRKKFIKMSGNTQAMYDKMTKDEVLYEKTRVNQEKKIKKKQDWIKKFGAKSTLASRAKSMTKMIEKMGQGDKLQDIATLDFKFNYLKYASKENMVSIKDLNFGYSDDEILIKNLSFRVREGDRICIVGKNGKGKSTLLKIIANELSVKLGEILYHERVEIGYFGQTNVDRLDKNKMIYEEVQSYAPDLPEGQIRRVCGQMLFSGSLAKKPISVLSGGERSRVLLAKILVRPVNLLFLDEPDNHLDMESCDALADAIDDFEGAILMVTHNEETIHTTANKLIVFDGGKVQFFDGSYAEFLSKVGWQDT